MKSMSASLEAEQKAKGEALRVKKALEGEINELEIGLDHANKANSEGLKSVKRYQGQMKEVIQLYEDEARSRSQIMEQVGISERKAAALSGEMEESKALMDSAERSRRQLEMEIGDGRNAVNSMQVINSRDMTFKRGLEGAIHTIQAEVDAMLGAAKNAEEKAKKAMVDAARLADELRCEQDVAMTLEKDNKLLEAQCKDAAARADEAEVNALKGGRKAMIKMETRIRELESELDAENRRNGDIFKNLRKSERTIKELTFASDEDKKHHERMQALIDQLQGKV
jgi:DNA repair exonuclease SbcCD ATPase subunit